MHTQQPSCIYTHTHNFFLVIRLLLLSNPYQNISDCFLLFPPDSDLIHLIDCSDGFIPGRCLSSPLNWVGLYLCTDLNSKLPYYAYISALHIFKRHNMADHRQTLAISPR